MAAKVVTGREKLIAKMEKAGVTLPVNASPDMTMGRAAELIEQMGRLLYEQGLEMDRLKAQRQKL